MSSSSSADTLSTLIARSLAHVRRDNPTGYEEMVRVAGDLGVNVRVGSEICCIEFDPHPRVRGCQMRTPDVEITGDRSSVAAVMSGELILGDAVSRDLLEVRGSLEAVVRAHDTLIAYVKAAIHSPPQKTLQRRFTKAPSRPGEEPDG